ncbi:hypothetical protein [Nocardia rhamnosiphila]
MTTLATTRLHNDMTGRQIRALTALVQHRAMQTDTLAEFLDTGRNHVYELLTELRDLDMIEPDLLRLAAPGGKWIVPNQRALNWYFGRRIRRWTPSLLWSVHGRAVNRTRIALRARDLDSWTSEREFTLGGCAPDFPGDAEWNTPHGDRILVKVDTVGHPIPVSKLAETLQRIVHRTRIDWCTGILWVCAGRTTADTVRTAAAGLADRSSALTDELTIAVHDYADLTNPSTPDRAPWGVA